MPVGGIRGLGRQIDSKADWAVLVSRVGVDLGLCLRGFRNQGAI
jgi:hypothetical protein